MYISEREWHNQGLHFHTQFVSPTPVLFPPCEKFSKAMDEMRKARGIDIALGNTIKKIDKDNRVAYFTNNASGEEVKFNYDFIHLVPPMSPPLSLRKSVLTNDAGWLPVNDRTLQHNEFTNVYGLGDCLTIPCAKTAAAVFSQVPVVVHNIIR